MGSRECIKETSESWLKECISINFDVDKYLSDSDQCTQRESQGGTKSYSMFLAQQCECALYERLLNVLSDGDRLRLMSNSGPTQRWVTALPLSWKNWNLTSREWLIAARRRLGLDVRTKESRCSNCRFYEIGLKGNHALRCSGKLGSKMRHDAIKVLLARAFKQACFAVRMEQNGGLLDKRRPADVEIQDWVLINNWKESTSLFIDIAIIDPKGDSYSKF